MKPFSPGERGPWFSAWLLLGWAAGVTGCSQPEAYQPSAPFEVQVQLSTNTVHIGDPFQVTLDIYHPTNAPPRLPELNQKRRIKVLHLEEEQNALLPRHYKTTRTYTLASFELGNHLIATGMIHSVADGVPLDSLPFPPLFITVKSLLQGTNDVLQPIKAPMRWKDASWSRWLLGLAIVILLSIVAGLLGGRAVSKRQQPLQTAPGRPPHLIALEALLALKTKPWIAAGEAEPFYVELSGIVRHYLEGRFDLHAPEQTTEEFIRNTSADASLTESQRELVISFLEQSDLVKFARLQPGADRMREALEAAEKLIIETSPAPEEP